jgi:hypothetical protein
LTVFLGQRRLAALTGGHLEGLAFDLFQSQWLKEAFPSMGNDAAWAISGQLDAFPDVPLQGKFVSIMSQNVVRRLLSVVRNAKHGGTLVFIEPAEQVALTRKGGPLRFKYRLAHTPACTRYQTLVARAITRLACLVHEQKLHAVSWDDYQRAPDPELNKLDEALFELAHFLADFMAVDGALVLTKRLEPIGFGAELRAEAPNLVEVRQALDVEATRWVNEPLEEVGTRHRAVYRLCEEHPHCVAIVISQDGAVRVVKNFNGAVTYWNQLSW